jgi:dTMP kinase
MGSLFVSFEGPEGAGKSTVIARVAGRATAMGRRTLVTRQPGAGVVGAAIRDVLLHGEGLPALTEAFLFLADRSYHVTMIVRPALERGEWVFCDRYADSTIVYQGRARGLDMESLRAWNAAATGGLDPDLTLLLDVPAESGLARALARQHPLAGLDAPSGEVPRQASRGDRLDREPLAFHQRVREGFLLEAERDPGRWRVIDASAPLEAVVAACWAEVEAAAAERP